MTLRLNGSTSGYTEIDAPAAAGSNTLILPTSNGAAGNILGTDGSGNLSWVNGRMVLATAQNSTSGTSIDFTGIPSWAKRITVMFYRISTSGTSQIILQAGSGSITASGYYSRVTSMNGASATNANAMGNGFGVISSANGNAANIISGQIILTLLGSNNWCCSGSTMDNTNQNVQWIQAGDVPLSGTLDRIRLTTVNGTDTFDAGSVNILYEG
jgi:hypothetical protein